MAALARSSSAASAVPAGLLAAALLSGGAWAAGAVHVVDIAAGAGSDFQFIGSAIAAAADGDVILVRDGTYNEAVMVDGKELTLQAESGATVVVNLGITVQNLAASQQVTIRGIDAVAPSLGSSIRFLEDDGPVWVEDASFAGTRTGAFPGGGVVAFNSDSVVLSRCVVDVFVQQLLAPGLNVLASNVVLDGCTINGVKGFDQSAVDGSPGCDGVRMSAGATLLATQSTIIGGAGGDYTGPPETCHDGGAGGTGITLGTGSTAVLHACTLLGGPGGATSGTCSTGSTGPLSSVEDGSTLIQDPRDLGTLEETSPVREGGTVQITATGEPGAVAWILYSDRQLRATGSRLFDGDLLVSIAPLGFVSLGTLPESGTTTVPFPAPFLGGALEGLAFHDQLVTLASSDGRVRLGGVSAVLLLDAAF